MLINGERPPICEHLDAKLPEGFSIIYFDRSPALPTMITFAVTHATGLMSDELDMSDVLIPDDTFNIRSIESMTVTAFVDRIYEKCVLPVIDKIRTQLEGSSNYTTHCNYKPASAFCRSPEE